MGPTRRLGVGSRARAQAHAHEVVLEGWAKRTGLASRSEARRRAARVLLAYAHDLASTRIAMAVAL